MCIRDWEVCSCSECGSYGAGEPGEEGGTCYEGFKSRLGALCAGQTAYSMWAGTAGQFILPSFLFIEDKYHCK